MSYDFDHTDRSIRIILVCLGIAVAIAATITSIVAKGMPAL